MVFNPTEKLFRMKRSSGHFNTQRFLKSGLHMKTGILFFLLLLSTGLSSCKKDSVAPAPVVTPPAPPVPPVENRFNINPALVNTHPTKEAAAVYAFLRENYGK